MSTISTQSFRRTRDHFQPEDMDPQEQRRIRGQLEQIDYTAYVANREVIAQALGSVGAQDFGQLAARTAQARARWVSEALRLSHSGAVATPDQINALSEARIAYEELAEAYDALRRLIERGYIPTTIGQSS